MSASGKNTTARDKQNKNVTFRWQLNLSIATFARGVDFMEHYRRKLEEMSLGSSSDVVGGQGNTRMHAATDKLHSEQKHVHIKVTPAYTGVWLGYRHLS